MRRRCCYIAHRYITGKEHKKTCISKAIYRRYTSRIGIEPTSTAPETVALSVRPTGHHSYYIGMATLFQTECISSNTPIKINTIIIQAAA